MYRGLNNKAPTYIVEFLQPVHSSQYSLRYNDNSKLKVSTTNCSTQGDRSYAAIGPKLWNDLPDFISNLETQPFKKKCKDLLIQ